MKPIFLSISILSVMLFSMLFLVPQQVKSQNNIGFHRFELTPMGGYQFGGRMYFYEGEYKIRDNANYGGAFSVNLPKGVALELNYTRMDTKGDWYPYNGYQIDYPQKTTPLAVNYFQLGVVKDFLHHRIRPFGLLSLGTTWFDIQETGVTDVWKFSMALGAGVKIFFTDYLGIRLQGRLLMPMYFTGVGFYYGAGPGGSGGGLTVGAGATFIQGDFQGGLIFAFGK